ncbi:hypothetical protein FNV43_RR19107 [Rhamnella rubrinervis]|uniref:Retrotransposon gag domain-containing protein n=1 Tax=Rhamnella rubrinervis TaxID=2594499 RepID=A0A8K0E5X4_9ROSA|nr:hypothetical protein FNV43_RR19107 [Rhamnella rubrinervis]
MHSYTVFAFKSPKSILIFPAIRVDLSVGSSLAVTTPVPQSFTFYLSFAETSLNPSNDVLSGDIITSISFSKKFNFELLLRNSLTPLYDQISHWAEPSRTKVEDWSGLSGPKERMDRFLNWLSEPSQLGRGSEWLLGSVGQDVLWSEYLNWLGSDVVRAEQRTAIVARNGRDGYRRFVEEQNRDDSALRTDKRPRGRVLEIEIHQGIEGPALLWFSRLPSRSIGSFSELARQFMTQFASSRQYRRDPDDLFRVQQLRGEPLREYIQRFNDMKVEIMDCPDVVACNAFKRGLLPGTKIYDYMVGKKPRNLLSKAELHLWKRPSSICNEQRKRDGLDLQKQYEPRQAYGLGRMKLLRSPTPVDKHMGESMMATTHELDPGGDNSQCTWRSCLRLRAQEDRKAYARQHIAEVHVTRQDDLDITFTAKDTEGVLYPHDDVLVVTLEVENYVMKRILVDNGSSTDIIFSSTLEAMRISPKVAEPSRATLVGYDGNESAKG